MKLIFFFKLLSVIFLFVSCSNEKVKKSVVIESVPKLGNVIMRYNTEKNGFEYWADRAIPHRFLCTVARKYVISFDAYEHYIDDQVEINAHYSGYLPKQENDIKTFKKDEALIIPQSLDYDSFSGLSNEVKSKLKLIRPKTLGQALRIDGVTPAAAIILLGAIKKAKYKVSA